MGGVTPDSLVDGLLSGLAHPILGWDHLAYLVAFAVLTARYNETRHNVARHNQTATISFCSIAALLSGVLLHVGGVSLPAVESAVSASIILIGVTLAVATHSLSRPALIFFALAGVVHGFALGETVASAEPTPLLAYLVGLAIIQSMLMLAIARSLQYLAHKTGVLSLVLARYAGAITVAIGIVAITRTAL